MRTPESLLRELVALPSVHPEADYGDTIPGEVAMASWMAAHLKKLGGDVRVSLLSPGRPSVIGVFEPQQKPKATILFAPHLDTVGIRGMSVSPFALTKRGGKLHGRGASDTKGPTAALLWALERWVSSPNRSRQPIRWIVAATAGEEQGSLGATALAKDGLSADFAVALEPTDLRVVTAAKGVLRLWVSTKGRAAHGSDPEAGENAIEKLLPFAAAIQSTLSPKLRTSRHPQLGRATVNLGVFAGGGELNIVPDHARLGLDIRTHPNWPEEDVLRLVRTIRDHRCRGAKIEIHRKGPSFVTDRRDPWARQLRTQARGWAVANWFSDANVFAANNIPSVAFGPGSIVQAHTHDEYIQTRELAAGAAAFRRFLLEAGF